MKVNELDVSVLRHHLQYMPSGALRWVRKTCKSGAVGAVAGCECHGYRYVSLNGERYAHHQLVWRWFGGDIPRGYELDHINQDKSDNRIENLRLVTRSQNAHNHGPKKNNTTGVRGVAWCKMREQFVATIRPNGKKKFLGRYDNLFDACCARKSAENRYKEIIKPTQGDV